MPWFRLDDSFYDNPKVRAAGNAAIGLWVRCATYSARHLTDGHIDATVVRAFGNTRDIERLLKVGLWVHESGGYWIPDYLEYNPSAADVRDQRKKRAEAGRKGGQKSAQTRRDPDAYK